MRSPLSRFLRKPGADRRLLALAAVLHVIVAIAVRVLRFRRVQRLLASLAAIGPRPSSVEGVEARAVQAVRTAGSLLPGANCLTEALVAQCLLARHRCDTTLCFGVAPIVAGERALDAHAWLERGGTSLIGARATAYDPLRRAC